MMNYGGWLHDEPWRLHNKTWRLVAWLLCMEVHNKMCRWHNTAWTLHEEFFLSRVQNEYVGAVLLLDQAWSRLFRASKAAALLGGPFQAATKR